MPVGKDIMLQHHKEFNGFRLSKISDVEFLAPRLRYEDKREILSSSGRSPYQALLTGFFQSDFCFTIVNTEDVPVGMYGVGGDGVIWLLASDDIKKIKISFLRESRQVVNFLNSKYRKLWNYVDCRNELHIRWLKWCGFIFIRKVNHGVENLPFYEFIKICVNQ